MALEEGRSPEQRPPSRSAGRPYFLGLFVSETRSRAFALAFAWILDAEGGLVDDPQDPGGTTNWGISKRAYPELDIPALTKAQAEDIYQRDYWQRCHCDSLPPAIALALFDSAVNQGPSRAIRLLQRSLGVTQDGVIGEETIAAARRAIPKDLLIDFLAWRAVEYARLSFRFHRGWFRRLFKLQQAIGAFA